jgi:hypothetical protein
VKLENVSREQWTVGGVALLLVIDLLFLPWFSISVPPFNVDLTATNAPDGWLGVLGMIAALAVLVDQAMELLAPHVNVPMIGGSRGGTRFYLAVAAAVFVALKFLFHIHFSIFGFGFWVGIVLTAALVFFTNQQRGASTYTPPLR